MARVPEINPVKYRTATITAKITRTMVSVDPTFFFMSTILNVTIAERQRLGKMWKYANMQICKCVNVFCAHLHTCTFAHCNRDFRIFAAYKNIEDENCRNPYRQGRDESKIL